MPFAMSTLPSIPDFYRNKNIFITGGTGFIGKVLIEKLLRSCPDLKAIYLLIREKKNRTVEERIKIITDLALFDSVRTQSPESLNKIKLVTGDIRQLSLGLAPQDRKLLTEEINVVFHAAEKTDRHVLNAFTEKFIRPLPNTYTFAKSLAEHVVHDLCEGRIPAVVYRPSIVISSAFEPIPGWIDNFNGPMGLLTACGKGIVRSIYGNPDVITDYVPVDITVKAIIISSWKQATFKEETKRCTPSFYNGSNRNINPVSLSDLVEIGKKLNSDVPFDNVLWYPNGTVTRCYYNYFIQMILYHLLPAMFVDLVLRMLGKKPILLKIQRRIYNAMVALEYFTQNHWDFLNEKCLNLKHELLPSDVEAFTYREDEVDIYDFVKRGTVGIRRYLLNEGEDLEKARRNSRRMWLLARTCSWLGYLALLWIVFVRIDVCTMFVHKCGQLFAYLTTD